VTIKYVLYTLFYKRKNQCLCDVEKIYMSKYTVNSIGVDVCACGGLLFLQSCVKAADGDIRHIRWQVLVKFEERLSFMCTISRTKNQ